MQDNQVQYVDYLQAQPRQQRQHVSYGYDMTPGRQERISPERQFMAALSHLHGTPTETESAIAYQKRAELVHALGITTWV